jgi:hypothetical protein
LSPAVDRALLGGDGGGPLRAKRSHATAEEWKRMLLAPLSKGCSLLLPEKPQK